eukprot:92809_1
MKALFYVVELYWFCVVMSRSDCSMSGSSIIATLNGTPAKRVLKHLHFCLGCSDPVHEGTHIWALGAAHGVQVFNVQGNVVYTVPNDCRGIPLNAEDMKGSIALIDRGVVPLLEKAKVVQSIGAIAAVIVDDGQCNSDMSNCGLIGSIDEGGFGGRERSQDWDEITIPMVLVSQAQGQRIKDMMHYRVVTVSEYGEQIVPL